MPTRFRWCQLFGCIAHPCCHMHWLIPPVECTFTLTIFSNQKQPRLTLTMFGGYSKYWNNFDISFNISLNICFVFKHMLVSCFNHSKSNTWHLLLLGESCLTPKIVAKFPDHDHLGRLGNKSMQIPNITKHWPNNVRHDGSYCFA